MGEQSPLVDVLVLPLQQAAQTAAGRGAVTDPDPSALSPTPCTKHAVAPPAHPAFGCGVALQLIVRLPLAGIVHVRPASSFTVCPESSLLLHATSKRTDAAKRERVLIIRA